MSPSTTPRTDPYSAETLAYVFFHRPRRSVAARTYESRLRAFHARLRDHPPDGFRDSSAFTLPRAPWNEPRPAPVYVDWYRLDGFAALGPIRRVAYRPPWVRPHRAVARLAGPGWGSLYSAQGRAGLPTASDHLAWRSDVPRTDDRSATKRTSAVWRRQLAIGPAPEFCVVRPAPRTERPRAGVWP